MNSEDFETMAKDLEIQAQQKVSRALSAIEVALSEWDATKKKPGILARRIEYLKMCHGIFSNWGKESLKGSKDINSTIKRLQSFTIMCEQLNKNIT